MYHGDRHAPLSHGRRAALDRAVTNVAGREDAGDAGLLKIGIALEWPGGRRTLVQQIDDVAAGTDVAPLIPDHRGRQPTGLRLPSDQHEERIARPPLPVTLVGRHLDRLKAILALHAGDFDTGLHPDVVLPVDLIEEVLRHAGRK